MTSKVKYSYACEKYKKQTQFLDFYYEHFGNFWVNHQMNGTFSKWHLYGTMDYIMHYDSKKYLPNNRLIFPIELVFDIDVPNYKENHLLRDQISDNFIKENMNHSIWRNGSDYGNHIHSFFPELNNYPTFHRQLLKQLLIQHYAGKENIKKFKIDMFVTYPKRLISLERSKHRNGGDRIKYLVRNFNFNKENKIPKQVIKKFEGKITTYDMDSIFIDLSVSDKPCIKFFETEEFSHIEDYRRRALFILASEYVRKGIPKNEVVHKLIKWRDYILNGYKGISDSFIKHTVLKANGRVTCKMRSQVLQEIGMESVVRKCPTCSKFLM